MESTIAYAQPWRRFMAFLYDGLLFVALIFCSSGLALLLTQGHSYQRYKILFWLANYLTWGLITAFNWYKTGQTLGMAAWKIKITYPNQNPSYLSHLLRYFVGSVNILSLGAGFLWCFFNVQRQSFADTLYGSEFKRI